MTDSPTPATPAAALSPEDAAAASSRASRTLLDSAVAHTIAALAHDLRNSLGVVSMQVEAIAARARSPLLEVSAIQGHASAASDHIERLANMTNALIAFARGRASSDLAVIVGEAVALVPLRAITLSTTTVAAVGLDPLLTRAVALEVLVLALGHQAAPSFEVFTDPAGSTLKVSSGEALAVDDAMEWVVQFQTVGGRIYPTADGIRLQFPPIV